MPPVETIWESCTTPAQILAMLRNKVSDRKLRLFACACCRRVADLSVVPELQRSIELMEGFVEGKVTHDQLKSARQRLKRRPSPRSVADLLVECAEYLLTGVGLYIANKCSGSAAKAYGLANGDSFDSLLDDYCEIGPNEQSHWNEQGSLLKEMTGNPFRPITLDQRWRTADVLDLARAIYEDRAFDRMPILADALMDAGCDNPDVIDHCRGGGPHVRGCWVVDLILGKE